METKRAKVIMLPTEHETCIVVNKYIMQGNSILSYEEAQILHSNCTNEQLKLKGYVHQHLYFITDDEIKEGDWVYNEDYGIGKVTDTSERNASNCHYQIDDEFGWHCSGCKKIVATTDPKLKIKDGKPYMSQDLVKVWVQKEKKLPQPSQAFIEKYCKVGGIDEVLIECETISTSAGEFVLLDDIDERGNIKIKVNSHNKITIHPIKDSWNREELIALIEYFYDIGYERCQYDYTLTASARKFDFNKLVEKRLNHGS